MKSKASGFYADSLEMLLDTMCNVLGAVIFLALMVAMLAHDVRPPTQTEYEEQAAQLTNALTSVANSNALLQAELQQVQQRLQEPRSKWQTNQMRLPNLSRTTKQPWAVIVRYGRLYPVYLLSEGSRANRLKNTRTIDWQGARAEQAEPRPEQGDEPESGVRDMAQNFRRSSRTNFYFAFWVYDDSFKEFNRAKETAANLGFQYGWEPLAADNPLALGGRGPSILPQN